MLGDIIKWDPELGSRCSVRKLLENLCDAVPEIEIRQCARGMELCLKETEDIFPIEDVGEISIDKSFSLLESIRFWVEDLIKRFIWGEVEKDTPEERTTSDVAIVIAIGLDGLIGIELSDGYVFITLTNTLAQLDLGPDIPVDKAAVMGMVTKILKWGSKR